MEGAIKLLLDNLAFAGRCNVVLISNDEEFVEALVLNPQPANSSFRSDARRMFVVSSAPRKFRLSHRLDTARSDVVTEPQKLTFPS